MSAAKQVAIYTRGITSMSLMGAYGAILLCDSTRKELSGSAPDSSNNRMDIMAAVEALRALKFPCRVTIYNTNTYLTDAITKGWVQRWQANGWRNSERRPTPHVELWKQLLELCANHEVTFEYLPFEPRNCEYARCDAIGHEAALWISTEASEGLIAITSEMIEAGMSSHGGWSRHQLACLGVTWPPPSGWKLAAVGRLIRRSEVEKFLSLKSGEEEKGMSFGLVEEAASPGATP